MHVGVVSHTFHLKNDHVPCVMIIEKCFTLSKYSVTRFDWMCLDGN